MDSSLPTAPRSSPTTEVSLPEISVVIPARNEEANLPTCLESLSTQSGVTFEIIVVDDGSSDRTREIASSFANVRVMSPGPLPDHWTGKNNALIAGGNVARARWLLFTDADTFHLPGSLARALAEAKKHQADLLSYSPEQMVVTFTERAVMPVVFAELAAQYPPQRVSDPESGVVAANGQYILVRREAYDAVGGHAAVATEILEDVALARRFRDAGYKVYFRYGGDAVRTRMYRNWAQLREGWTKNLALLFPHAERLALQSMALWLGAWLSLGVAVAAIDGQHFGTAAVAIIWVLVFRRIHRAHFATSNNLIAIAFGLPIFAHLLLISRRAHKSGRVVWKNREYGSKTDRDSCQLLMANSQLLN